MFLLPALLIGGLVVGAAVMNRARTDDPTADAMSDGRDPDRPGVRGSTSTTAGKTRPGRRLNMETRETTIDVAVEMDSAHNREPVSVRIGTFPADAIALEGSLYLWPEVASGWERSLCMQLVWDGKGQEIAGVLAAGKQKTLVADTFNAIAEGSPACLANVRSMYAHELHNYTGGERLRFIAERVPALMISPSTTPGVADLWIVLPAADGGRYLVEGNIRAKYRRQRGSP